MRRVVRYPRFLLDTEEAALRIAEDSTEFALRFLDAIEASADLLARSPYVGARVLPETPRTKGWRVIAVRRFRNYLIYYRVLDDQVELIRVIHGARDQKATIAEDAPVP